MLMKTTMCRKLFYVTVLWFMLLIYNNTARLLTSCLFVLGNLSLVLPVSIEGFDWFHTRFSRLPALKFETSDTLDKWNSTTPHVGLHHPQLNLVSYSCGWVMTKLRTKGLTTRLRKILQRRIYLWHRPRSGAGPAQEMPNSVCLCEGLAWAA